jgi:lysophospholipase
MKYRWLKLGITICLATLCSGCIEYPALDMDSDEVVGAYRDFYHSDVLPYYESGEFGTFAGSEGIDIAYRTFEKNDETGAIILLHGLNETALKYAELIYDLQGTGFSVYIMEHRGHGNSGRLLTGTDQDLRKVYIDDFENYVKDVKLFYDQIVMPKSHEKVFVFAHSLGGCIAVRYMETYTRDFDAAVLSSPMLQILTTHPAQLDESVAYPLVSAMVALGLGEEYALDMEEPEVLVDSKDPEKFEQELLTKSWKRWTVYNELIEDRPHLIAGGPGATWGVTNRFVKLAYEATFKARSFGEARKIKTPILLLRSDDDWLVGPEGPEKLQKRAVNCEEFRIMHFPDAYHEAYMERDAIRDVVVDSTIGFFQDHL